MNAKHITTAGGEEDKNVSSGNPKAPITLQKALGKYIEYSGEKTEAMDIDADAEKLQKKSPELYEEVERLREKSQELHKAAKKLYKECKYYFQKINEKYKNEEQLKLSSPDDNLSHSWGDYAYAQAYS